MSGRLIVAASSPTESTATSANEQPTAGKPIPSAAARKTADDAIRRIFKADFAASRTPTAKAALAKKLMDVAGEDTDSTNRFVLLEMSVEFASDAGQFLLADNAVRAMEAEFSVNGKSVRRDALIRALKQASGDDLAEAIDRGLEASAAALATDDFDGAVALSREIAVAARRAADKARQQSASAVISEIKSRQRDLQKLRPWFEKLEANPGDAVSLEYVGSFFCFERGDWEKGLQLLRKINGGELARLAELDIAADREPESAIASADGWTRYADGKQKSIQVACLRRAQMRYEQGLPALSGLSKARVSEALSSISKMVGDDHTNWVVVFRSDDPKVWNTQTNTGFTNFAVPVVSAPIGVRYVRLRRGNNDQVILATTRAKLASTWSDGRYGWSGDGRSQHGDVMLGIFDLQPPVPRQQGKVAIGYAIDGKPDAVYTGWGFGHLQLSGTTQDFCWHGDRLPPELLEISVLCRDLNSRELPSLLK